MEDQENQTVEIPEFKEVIEEAYNTEGLLPQEVEMAKEHGFVKEEADESVKKLDKEEKDGEHTEQPKPETSEDISEEGEEKKEEVAKPLFEETEKDESLAEKYNPNEKALYWKWKNDKRKRQDAQKERDEVKAKYDLDTIKDNVSTRKLNEITKALGKEDLTIEMLQGIIDNQQVAEKDDSSPLTKADLKRMEDDKVKASELQAEQEKALSMRILTTEKVGKAKYPNFDEIVKVAQEVVDTDNSHTYQEILASAFSDENMDEETLIERVVTIAKLSPKYEEVTKSVKSEDKDKVNRAIKNSKKKISSAALGTSGSKRMVNEDELTPDDAVHLTPDQFLKLKPGTRERLLMGG